MWTKEQIEARRDMWVRSEVHSAPVMSTEYLELCRLALQGLEHGDRAERAESEVERLQEALDDLHDMYDRLMVRMSSTAAARQDVVAQILAALPENLANAHAVEAMGITLGDDSLATEGRARALATLFIEEALVVLNLRDKRPLETVDTTALGQDVLDAIDALPRDMTRAQKLRYMRNNAIHGFAEPLFDAVAKHVEEGE